MYYLSMDLKGSPLTIIAIYNLAMSLYSITKYGCLVMRTYKTKLNGYLVMSLYDQIRVFSYEDLIKWVFSYKSTS